jgi:hypothetical protein
MDRWWITNQGIRCFLLGGEFSKVYPERSEGSPVQPAGTFQLAARRDATGDPSLSLGIN